MLNWLKRQYYRWQIQSWTEAKRIVVKALILSILVRDKESEIQFRRDLSLCNSEVNCYQHKLDALGKNPHK